MFGSLYIANLSRNVAEHYKNPDPIRTFHRIPNEWDEGERTEEEDLLRLPRAAMVTTKCQHLVFNRFIRGKALSRVITYNLLLKIWIAYIQLTPCDNANDPASWNQFYLYDYTLFDLLWTVLFASHIRIRPTTNEASMIGWV